MGYMCHYQFWFPQGICLGVGFLGHMVVLFLVFFMKLYTVFHAAAAKSLQLCPTLCNPIDSSPPGSPVPRILQARTLKWVVISFSNA